MNHMLTMHRTPAATTLDTHTEQLDGFPDLVLPSQPTAASTSSIAKRQNKFQKQRSTSNVSGSMDSVTSEEGLHMVHELSQMTSVLPVCAMNTPYTCCVLSRIKRATHAIHNNHGATHFDEDGDGDGDTDENDTHFDSFEWKVKAVDQKKRRAQDALLFREIKAGLIPEQLLKKIPRMGALVSLDLSYFSLGDDLGNCLGQR